MKALHSSRALLVLAAALVLPTAAIAADLVAIDSEVLWIPPHDSFTTKDQRTKGKYSQNYQIDNKTHEVLFLELVRTV